MRDAKAKRKRDLELRQQQEEEEKWMKAPRNQHDGSSTLGYEDVDLSNLINNSRIQSKEDSVRLGYVEGKSDCITYRFQYVST